MARVIQHEKLIDMPTANFYASDDRLSLMDEDAQQRFREFAAQKLTCGDIALRPEEISVRLIRIEQSSQTMGDLELDVHAHEFAERVERQDDLCREFGEFLQGELQVCHRARVWLVLSQLGHSV